MFKQINSLDRDLSKGYPGHCVENELNTGNSKVKETTQEVGQVETRKWRNVIKYKTYLIHVTTGKGNIKDNSQIASWGNLVDGGTIY